MSAGSALAVIGGTGLYALPGLDGLERLSAHTPYGAPSGAVVAGRLGEQCVLFLARHGEDHSIPPHRVNYRANLWALREAGAQRVVAVNAVGGIREDLQAGVIALPEQIIDYTWGRASSFWDEAGGEALHVDFSEPYTADLRDALRTASRAAGVELREGGCYAATQGPRLESRAEIRRLRRDGCDLVGMTGMPEAGLARELGLDYACLALVANRAAGCGAESEISVDEIHVRLAEMTERVLRLLAALCRSMARSQ